MAVPAAAEIKVGVINYARLFEESPQAKVVRDSLQAEFGPRLQQLVTQENALKAKGEKLQKDVATMTPEQRRSEEHTSELQSQSNLVCRLLLEKKKKTKKKKKHTKSKEKNMKQSN